jgi:hypothetical protein
MALGWSLLYGIGWNSELDQAMKLKPKDFKKRAALIKKADASLTAAMKDVEGSCASYIKDKQLTVDHLNAVLEQAKKLLRPLGLGILSFPRSQTLVWERANWCPK